MKLARSDENLKFNKFSVFRLDWKITWVKVIIKFNQLVSLVCLRQIMETAQTLLKPVTDASGRRHYRSSLQVIHFFSPCHAMYPQYEPLFAGFRGAETCNSFDRRQKTLLASGKAQARCC